MSDLHPKAVITGREETILQLASEGLTDNSIAGKLGISKGTVEGHWVRIRLKLGAASRTEAVAIRLESRKAVVEAREHLLMAAVAERETEEVALRKAQAVLERHVEQRTAELTSANERLRQEIADRLEAERALKESEARFKSIVANTAAGYFFVDLNGVFRAVNDAWLRLHKYDAAEEVLGRPFSLTQVGADLPEADDIVKRVFETEAARGGEFTRRCKDGSVGWHTFTVGPVLKGGEVVGLEGFLIDITERKLADAALFESERRYNDMLSRAELIWIMLDRDGRVTFCNDYLLRLTDRTREEVLGSNWFELFIPPENDELKSTFAALLDDQPASWHHENEIVTRSGARRLIRWTNTLLRSASGAAVGTAGIGEQVTHPQSH